MLGYFLLGVMIGMIKDYLLYLKNNPNEPLFIVLVNKNYKLLYLL